MLRFDGDRLSRFLAIIAIALFGIILAGTFWALVSERSGHKDGGTSLFAGGTRNPGPAEIQAADTEGKTAIFGELGLLRAVTADTQPVTVIVSLFFPYPSDDLAFREELVQKTRQLRLAVLDWFQTHTIADIRRAGEDGVKHDLIEQMNRTLVLGQIRILYFEEYMVLE